MSEPESRALMDFTIAHRNIAAILTFGQSDNLVTPPDAAGKLAAPTPLNLPAFADASNATVFESGMLWRGGGFGGGGFGGGGFGFGAGGGGTRLRGAQPGANNNPASGRRPDTTVHRADIEYFKAVSEAYKSVTGIKVLPPLRRPRGAFFQFGYYQFGVPSFTTPGWALPTAAPGAKPSAAGDAKPAGGADARAAATGDAAILRALEGAGVNAFVPWTAYKHAQLGDVEIGGFRPSVTSNAPAKDLAELGRKHGEFVGEGVLGHAHIGKGVVEVALGDYNCDGSFQLYDVSIVEKIMRHELGHAIGLGHSNNTQSIMYPSMKPNYAYCLLS